MAEEVISVETTTEVHNEDESFLDQLDEEGSVSGEVSIQADSDSEGSAVDEDVSLDQIFLTSTGCDSTHKICIYSTVDLCHNQVTYSLAASTFDIFGRRGRNGIVIKPPHTCHQITYL